MKFRSLIVCLPVLVTCVPAFAENVIHKVTPNWTKENGIIMEARRSENGAIQFYVARYLDKAPAWENDPELTTRRSAYLELRDSESKKMILSTQVAAETNNNTIVYKFALSPETIPSARFYLSESPAYKDPAKPPTVIMQTSGGQMYGFDLSAFAAPLLKPKQP